VGNSVTNLAWRAKHFAQEALIYVENGDHHRSETPARRAMVSLNSNVVNVP
jgi:hypothetical protein